MAYNICQVCASLLFHHQFRLEEWLSRHQSFAFVPVVLVAIFHLQDACFFTKSPYAVVWMTDILCLNDLRSSRTSKSAVTRISTDPRRIQTGRKFDHCLLFTVCQNQSDFRALMDVSNVRSMLTTATIIQIIQTAIYSMHLVRHTRCIPFRRYCRTRRILK